MYEEIISSCASFLCSQPSFRNFIAAGLYVVVVRAGDVLLVGKLHPPPAGALALKKCSGYLVKGCVIFIECIFFMYPRFTCATASAFNKIPYHLAYLFCR